MDSLILRELTNRDEGFLRSLVWLAARWDDAQPPPQPSSLPVGLERYVCDFGGPTDRGLLARRDGSPVGACWIRERIHGYGFVDDDVGELSMAVVPQMRGSGIGRALLSGVLDVEAGPISLSVDARNPARRLYESFGFARVSESLGAWTMLREP